MLGQRDNGTYLLFPWVLLWLFIFWLCTAYSFAETIIGTPESPRRTCAGVEILRTRVKKLSSNWRQNGFLWKPKAEHYNGVVVVTLPIGDVTSAIVSDAKGFRKKLVFRSDGDAGRAFTDYRNNGLSYAKRFGQVYVTLRGKRKRTFYLPCPGGRSDGLSK